MTPRTLAVAALLVVPVSTLLVACDRRGEDTSPSQAIEQRALQRDLQRDLDLAMAPDSQPGREIALADVPAPAAEAAPEQPAVAPPPPAQPERETPPPAQPKERKPPVQRPSRPEPSRPADEIEPVAPAPRAPEYSTRTAVAGQTFSVSFDRQVSRRNDVGSTFTATLTDALVDDLGRTVIPAGAAVTGRVEGGQRGRIALAFTSITYGGNHYAIDASVVTSPVTRQINMDSRGERVAKVAAPAAAGAVIGRVIGHNRRGAVIGAVIGAAAGAATAGATADVDTVVDPGATATIRLDGPLSVRRRVD
ncbi:MAG TPA: hypothetical protein VFJ16_18240 [Longimicrobium sp.]|nr:hypothetical protein [Longimicrobium sp.]